MKKDMEKDLYEREQRQKERKAHYEAADQNDRMVINLRDISHIMRGLSEGKGSQRRILILLLEAGTMTQRRLTERIGIQPGSASEVIAKLEKGGLIARTESEADRRTTDIVLTDQGRSEAEEALKQRQMRHEEMFSCLTEEEKNTLLSLLEKVNDDWSKRYQNLEGHHHGHHHCGHHEEHHQGHGDGHREQGEGKHHHRGEGR